MNSLDCCLKIALCTCKINHFDIIYIGGGRIYKFNQSSHLLETELWSATCGC